MSLTNIVREKANRVALLTLEVGRVQADVKDIKHRLDVREKRVVYERPPRNEHDKNAETRKAWVSGVLLNDIECDELRMQLHEKEVSLMNLETALSAAGVVKQGVEFAIRSEGIQTLKFVYGMTDDHLDARLFGGDDVDAAIDRAIHGAMGDYEPEVRTNIIRDTASEAGPLKPIPDNITKFPDKKFTKENDLEKFEAAIARQHDGGGFGGGSVSVPAVAGDSAKGYWVPPTDEELDADAADIPF